MPIDMTADADLSHDGERELRALAAAVYPPAVIPTLPGSALAWARAERRILVRDGGCLVAHVGLLSRAVSLDGHTVRVGGILGVMTHPAARGRGHASAGMRCAAARFAREPDLAFALLTCPPARVPFYARLGWRRFGGRLLVAQPDGVIAFTVGAVLVLPVQGPAPEAGTLDLCGLPW
jgi:aminoglycoside 2'-N-acetyltransferase I